MNTEQVNYSEWESVPAMVADRVVSGTKIRSAYEKIAMTTGDLPGSIATWHVNDDVLCIYRPGTDCALPKFAADYSRVRWLRLEDAEPDLDREVFLKVSAVPGVSHAYNLLNRVPTIKPTPLSNALASAVLLGGLGYGTGALVENVFPEHLVSRGRLRKNLALAGGLGGLALGGLRGAATAKKMRQGFLQSMITPNDTPVRRYPGAIKESNFYGDYPGGVSINPYSPNHLNSPLNAADRMRQSRQFGTAPTANLYTPSVHIPSFNRITWGDAQNYSRTGNPTYTTPATAAMTTGLMSGIGAARRSSIVRPSDVIKGLASAGVGLGTAHVAGRALSALAGLTPAGQKKLQTLGMWGGMLNSVVSPLLR